MLNSVSSSVETQKIYDQKADHNCIVHYTITKTSIELSHLKITITRLGLVKDYI